jgi:hypothetical protein
MLIKHLNKLGRICILRCKDGDVAVIVHDTPECTQGADQ